LQAAFSAFGFTIGVQQIYPASFCVRRRWAPMTIARWILKTRAVFGPPSKLTESSCDGDLFPSATTLYQSRRVFPPRSRLRVTGVRPTSGRNHLRTRRPIFRAMGESPSNACILRRQCDDGDVDVPSTPSGGVPRRSWHRSCRRRLASTPALRRQGVSASRQLLLSARCWLCHLCRCVQRNPVDSGRKEPPCSPSLGYPRRSNGSAAQLRKPPKPSLLPHPDHRPIALLALSARACARFLQHLSRLLARRQGRRRL
jgi:hypothetical protein